jgi:hypothetical protein
VAHDPSKHAIGVAKEVQCIREHHTVDGRSAERAAQVTR